MKKERPYRERESLVVGGGTDEVDVESRVRRISIPSTYPLGPSFQDNGADRNACSGCILWWCTSGQTEFGIFHLSSHHG